MQQLHYSGNESSSSIVSRRARNSYGVVCRKVYDPRNRAHYGERPDRDRRDGQTWMVDQIEWLIKGVSTAFSMEISVVSDATQNTPLSTDSPVQKRFQRKIDGGEENVGWEAEIVMSSEPADRLPSSKRQGEVDTVALIHGRYESSDLEWRSRGLFNPVRYADTDLIVRVVLGHADLKFEVYGKDGRQRLDDGSHGSVSVQWHAPEPSSRRGR
jgi:hypothetical protein